MSTFVFPHGARLRDGFVLLLLLLLLLKEQEGGHFLREGRKRVVRKSGRYY